MTEVNPAFHGMIFNKTVDVFLHNNARKNVFKGDWSEKDKTEFKALFNDLWDLALETRKEKAQ